VAEGHALPRGQRDSRDARKKQPPLAALLALGPGFAMCFAHAPQDDGLKGGLALIARPPGHPSHNALPCPGAFRVRFYAHTLGQIDETRSNRGELCNLCIRFKVSPIYQLDNC
jgi:hypothetical protein